MATNYYYLISGLPELTPDDRKISFTSISLRAHLKDHLTEHDFKLVKLFYLPFDHNNLLDTFFGEQQKWDNRGNFTKEHINEVADKKHFDTVNLDQYPDYWKEFLELMHSDCAPTDDVAASRLLSAKYYDYLETFDNEFVSKVARYQRNVANIITALNARNFGLDLEGNLVGHDEVVDALKKSQACDFGLSSALEYVDDITQIYEIENITERERKLDLYKWKYLEDLTFFNYFTVEKVIAFLLKLFIVERWYHLDEEKGKEAFEEIFNEIKSEFKFPEEYTLTYGKKR